MKSAPQVCCPTAVARPLRPWVLWAACGVFGVGILLEMATGADLRLSAYFYNPTATPAWWRGTSLPWRWLYQYGAYPALGLTAWALVCTGISLWYRPWRAYRRACMLFILVVALGPGLLVNSALKPYWGRPRPRHLTMFGGTAVYRPWWQPGGPTAGPSFPSGHAAIGYSLVASIVLLPRRYAPGLHWLALGGALSYGTLMGLARMLQGGHFASDVLWAGGLVCGLTAFLQSVYGRPAPGCLTAGGARRGSTCAC